MKNVKNLFEEFQKEAKLRIENGDFKVRSARAYSVTLSSNGYMGDIKINIDGIELHYALHPEEYVCEHGNIKVFINENISHRAFSQLKEAFVKNSKESYANEIKELEIRIEKLKNESNII